MRSTKTRIWLCMCLICLNLMFIWGNSLMPGEASKQFSQWVSSLLGEILHSDAVQTDGGHGLLRKVAHFSEFASLGFLLCWRFGMAGRQGSALAVPTLLGGILTACVDETIQIFAIERGPGLKDVLIDTCGATFGMIVLLLGHHWIKTHHRKKFWEETT